MLLGLHLHLLRWRLDLRLRWHLQLQNGVHEYARLHISYDILTFASILDTYAQHTPTRTVHESPPPPALLQFHLHLLCCCSLFLFILYIQ